MNKYPANLILFDGVCNLCSNSVQFVIKRDKSKRYHFASLQSQTGQKLLWENNMNAENFDSFILLERGKIYTKSTAALRVAITLGWFWWMLGIFLVVPVPIRNAVYNYIAKNRYKWYGKKEECWIPTPELKERFLD